MLRLNEGTLHASNNSCRVEVAGDQWATDRRRPIAAQMTRREERHVHQISLFSTNSRKLNTRQFGFVVCSERTSVRPLRMDESGDITLRISSNTECGWGLAKQNNNSKGSNRTYDVIYYFILHIWPLSIYIYSIDKSQKEITYILNFNVQMQTESK